MSPEVDISVRELRNHTADVMRAIEDGTITYLTKYGERIAKITPLRPTTWSDHVTAVLGGGDPYDSGLADLLADDDVASAEASAEFEHVEPPRTST